MLPVLGKLPCQGEASKPPRKNAPPAEEGGDSTSPHEGVLTPPSARSASEGDSGRRLLTPPPSTPSPPVAGLRPESIELYSPEVYTDGKWHHWVLSGAKWVRVLPQLGPSPKIDQKPCCQACWEQLLLETPALIQRACEQDERDAELAARLGRMYFLFSVLDSC